MKSNPKRPQTVREAREGEIVYRNGAVVNDLICVSGNLGAAYMGLQLLEREKKIFESTSRQPVLDEYQYLLQRQLKPEPRGDIIQLLRDLHVKPGAMIDISDGLSSELLHICYESKTGCRIYESKIPVDPETRKMAGEMNIDPITAALNGGEDYELLFTIPLSLFDKIGPRPEISVIGHIVNRKEGMKLVTAQGNEMELTAQGWTGF